MRLLIATTMRPPTQDAANKVFAQIRESAAEGNLEIPPGIIWTHGPGCYNLAFDLIGDDEEAERFANALTMALMPAKWGTTADKLPEVDTVEFL